MSKNNKKKTDGFEQIEEATISTEQFIEKNQKLIVRGILLVLVVAALIFGYHRFYKEPLAKEALTKLATAEENFGKDSFNLALHGDDNAYGLLDIIDKYGSTPSGNLAQYYAGLSYLYLGEYQNAIKHLEKFSSKDRVFSNLAKSNIGDAYMEMGDYRNAAEYYKRATSANTNELTAPQILMKAGLAYEKANDFKSALAMYEKLEKEFSKSIEAGEIEKYITRAKSRI